jgi:hypothetical protein
LVPRFAVGVVGTAEDAVLGWVCSPHCTASGKCWRVAKSHGVRAGTAAPGASPAICLRPNRQSRIYGRHSIGRLESRQVGKRKTAFFGQKRDLLTTRPLKKRPRYPRRDRHYGWRVTHAGAFSLFAAPVTRVWWTALFFFYLRYNNRNRCFVNRAF